MPPKTVCLEPVSKSSVKTLTARPDDRRTGRQGQLLLNAALGFDLCDAFVDHLIVLAGRDF